MLRSMTGFGRAQGPVGSATVTVLVRTLNNKQLDLAVKLPLRFRDQEAACREIASRVLLRGKIDIMVTLEDHGIHSVKINPSNARNYHNEIKDLSKELGVAEPENWIELLMRLPDVINSGSDDVSEEEWDALALLIKQACEDTDNHRRNEAIALSEDMLQRIGLIESALPEIEKFDPERKIFLSERLKKDLQQFLPEVKTDESRLEQELFYYVDKFDITEEKVRLANHLTYFKETLLSDSEEPSGKKLGFITQEIGREINTLGNKSNHFEIQKLVVGMKDELEKIKEQLANIL